MDYKGKYAELFGLESDTNYWVRSQNYHSVIDEYPDIEAVFVAKSAKVIDKGTEAQYTGVIVFDAKASSSSDWNKIVYEITSRVQDITTIETNAFGSGKAVILKGIVSSYDSKTGDKRNTITVTPDNYSGSAKFTVQLGSIYTGT